MNIETAKECDSLLKILSQHGLGYEIPVEDLSKLTGIAQAKVETILFSLMFSEYVQSDVEKAPNGKNIRKFFITAKGKIFIDSGGFTDKAKTDKIMLVCTVIAAVASVLALIIGLVALFQK